MLCESTTGRHGFRSSLLSACAGHPFPEAAARYSNERASLSPRRVHKPVGDARFPRAGKSNPLCPSPSRREPRTTTVGIRLADYYICECEQGHNT